MKAEGEKNLLQPTPLVDKVGEATTHLQRSVRGQCAGIRRVSALLPHSVRVLMRYRDSFTIYV
jgi:hypothetical protein